MYENCADEIFVRQFGDKFRYFLSMHIKTKIYQNRVYIGYMKTVNINLN